MNVKDKIKCVKFVNTSIDEQIKIGHIYEVGEVEYGCVRLLGSDGILSTLYYPMDWFEKVER